MMDLFTYMNRENNFRSSTIGDGMDGVYYHGVKQLNDDLDFEEKLKKKLEKEKDSEKSA